MYQKGLLHREFTGDDGVHHRQLCVPRDLVTTVIKLAHETQMVGHLSFKKTRDRVWLCFYWKGMEADIRKYIKSCDVCKTVPKGSARAAPLNQVPLLDVPFKRVAIDIIGPIKTPSDRGHRYVLVHMDLATRYPDAVPLKRNDASTIAETLFNLWTGVGIPEEVLSENQNHFNE